MAEAKEVLHILVRSDGVSSDPTKVGVLRNAKAKREFRSFHTKIFRLYRQTERPSQGFVSMGVNWGTFSRIRLDGSELRDLLKDSSRWEWTEGSSQGFVSMGVNWGTFSRIRLDGSELRTPVCYIIFIPS